MHIRLFNENQNSFSFVHTVTGGVLYFKKNQIQKVVEKIRTFFQKNLHFRRNIRKFKRI